MIISVPEYDFSVNTNILAYCLVRHSDYHKAWILEGHFKTSQGLEPQLLYLSPSETDVRAAHDLFIKRVPNPSI